MRFKVFQSKETFVRFILHRSGETEEILRSINVPSMTNQTVKEAFGKSWCIDLGCERR